MHLGELVDKGRLVLYFFPKAFTPGCDREAALFQKNYAELKSRGIEVVGVSRDSLETQSRYCQEKSLEFPVVADEDGSIARLYGVLTSAGYANRVSFGIDRGGQVVHVVENRAPEPHVERALAWAGLARLP